MISEWQSLCSWKGYTLLKETNRTFIDKGTFSIQVNVHACSWGHSECFLTTCVLKCHPVLLSACIKACLDFVKWPWSRKFPQLLLFYRNPSHLLFPGDRKVSTLALSLQSTPRSCNRMVSPCQMPKFIHTWLQSFLVQILTHLHFITGFPVQTTTLP